MFKKPAEEKKPDPVHQHFAYHTVLEIKAAIQLVNDALATGQLETRWRTSHPRLTVLSQGHAFSMEDPRYMGHPLEDVSELPIKGPECLAAEQRKLKADQLQRARETLAKSMDEVERLARELGLDR